MDLIMSEIEPNMENKVMFPLCSPKTTPGGGNPTFTTPSVNTIPNQSADYNKSRNPHRKHYASNQPIKLPKTDRIIHNRYVVNVVFICAPSRSINFLNSSYGILL